MDALWIRGILSNTTCNFAIRGPVDFWKPVSESTDSCLFKTLPKKLIDHVAPKISALTLINKNHQKMPKLWTALLVNLRPLWIFWPQKYFTSNYKYMTYLRGGGAEKNSQNIRMHRATGAPRDAWPYALALVGWWQYTRFSIINFHQKWAFYINVCLRALSHPSQGAIDFPLSIDTQYIGPCVS